MRWWWDPLCTRQTTLSLIFIVLAHWNNSPRIEISPHSDTLSWFRANQSLIFLLNCYLLIGEATNTNVKVFDMTRSGLEPTIYHTRGEHANHYTTDVVGSLWDSNTLKLWQWMKIILTILCGCNWLIRFMTVHIIQLKKIYQNEWMWSSGLGRWT